MSETNKVMSSLQFPNTQQPYQVNDARIPANPGAYKYMATDGEGNWVAEDRLAYAATSEVVIYPKTTVSLFAQNNAYIQVLESSVVHSGDSIDVSFNGHQYHLAANVIQSVLLFGNASLFGLLQGITIDQAVAAGFPNTGEPFLLAPQSGGWALVTADITTVEIEIKGESTVYKTVDDVFLPDNVKLWKTGPTYAPLFKNTSPNYDVYVTFNGLKYYLATSNLITLAEGTEYACRRENKDNGVYTSVTSGVEVGENCRVCSAFVVVDEAGTCSFFDVSLNQTFTFEAPQAGTYVLETAALYYHDICKISYAYPACNALMLTAGGANVRLTSTSSGKLEVINGYNDKKEYLLTERSDVEIYTAAGSSNMTFSEVCSLVENDKARFTIPSYGIAVPVQSSYVANKNIDGTAQTAIVIDCFYTVVADTGVTLKVVNVVWGETSGMTVTEKVVE